MSINKYEYVEDSALLGELFTGAGTTEDEAYMSMPHKARTSKEYSKRKTAKYSFYTALGCAAVVLIPSTAQNLSDFFGAIAPRAEYKNSVVDPGKATVEKISFDMPPITLVTADTRLTGIKVAGGSHLSTIVGNIPLSSYTLTRDADVETGVTVDLGKVSIEYDDSTKKLTYTVPDAALATDTNIPTGEAVTTETSSSLESLPVDVLAKVADAIGGTFGKNGSDVFGIGAASTYASKINNNLTEFADLAIATSVDEKCTPLISAIPDFDTQVKNNIKIAVQGKLLDIKETRADAGLSLLMSKSGAEIQRIAENATVEMSSNDNISPDQENIKKLNKFISSKEFTTSLDPSRDITCGVSKDATLKLVDKGTK